MVADEEQHRLMSGDQESVTDGSLRRSRKEVGDGAYLNRFTIQTAPRNRKSSVESRHGRDGGSMIKNRQTGQDPDPLSRRELHNGDRIGFQYKLCNDLDNYFKQATCK
ncbi:hypothetical protein JTE90_010458 [Oedothorax gibbosus]|uniref:Uncharacterized protein n=1 Tax=Oedothorax gibbosus TaxID=931172 RepID=A0AAV6W5S1_9ARAC|nr:hypothetical protein JTE90_010458 [Oedothorax gibbosus]